MHTKSKLDVPQSTPQNQNKFVISPTAGLIWAHNGANVGLGGGLASPIPQIATWRSERPGAAKPSIVGRICGR